MMKEVMLKNRLQEMELYKLYSGDAAFNSAMQQSLQQMLAV